MAPREGAKQHVPAGYVRRALERNTVILEFIDEEMARHFHERGFARHFHERGFAPAPKDEKP